MRRSSMMDIQFTSIKTRKPPMSRRDHLRMLAIICGWTVMIPAVFAIITMGFTALHVALGAPV